MSKNKLKEKRKTIMELKNISANFLGDSITEGCGTSGADKIFHAILAKKPE